MSQNRTLLRVSGPASAVEAAFGVHLHDYAAADGRRFYAPDAAPTMTADLAGHLLTVIGLDNAPALHPFIHAVKPPTGSLQALPPDAQPLTAQPSFYSSNPTGLTPADIHTIYDVPSGTGHDGKGQTLAVFELDTYYQSDIAAYEAAFGLPSPVLQNIGVDGFDTNTAPGSGEAEVDLDIELEIAMDPKATSVLVYEAVNSFAALIDEYNKIATDDRASEISSSWGIGEGQNPAGNAQTENQIFQQMAAQGQSMTAAAGDGGAYSDGDTNLYTDDPGSQPYVLGVGGTNLSDASSGTTPPYAVYTSESSWGDAADTGRGPQGTGGGGGISHVWPIPSWQVGSFTTTMNPQGSTTMRNVPDVALDGDYDVNAYAVYINGSFAGYNGTSAASPVWAGLLGLVNQQRAAVGAGPIGFAAPSIYATAKNPTKYARDFHDIADGSSNLYYNAVTGYDNSTGWGSFIATPLITDLTGYVSGVTKITSISPVSVAAGSGPFTLTVNGSTFYSGAQIAFKGTLLTTTRVSTTKLQATVPASLIAASGLVPVTADNPNFVTTSNTISFKVTPTAAPAITSFSPATRTGRNQRDRDGNGLHRRHLGQVPRRGGGVHRQQRRNANPHLCPFRGIHRTDHGDDPHRHRHFGERLRRSCPAGHYLVHAGVRPGRNDSDHHRTRLYRHHRRQLQWLGVSCRDLYVSLRHAGHGHRAAVREDRKDHGCHRALATR